MARRAALRSAVVNQATLCLGPPGFHLHAFDHPGLRAPLAHIAVMEILGFTLR